MVEKRNDCPYLAPCPFFKSLALPASAEVFKVQYCRSDYRKCKRYLLRSAEKAVPDGMWPDGTLPARA
jgi:hypothetical protein